MEVKVHTEHNKEELSEALATFISVIMRERWSPRVSWRVSKYMKLCCQIFDKEVYKDAKVIAGEEVMTPRPKEQRNGKTLRENIKGPRGRCGDCS